MRLDLFLAGHDTQLSRTFIRNQIMAGRVLVDDRGAKVAYRVHEGQIVKALPFEHVADSPEPEDIPLDILFEDEDFAVVNKAAGMVVHPAKGHWSGTLTSALTFHFQSLSSVGGATRPGIVHRLDRDTSGVILIAKNNGAHQNLAAQFEARDDGAAAIRALEAAATVAPATASTFARLAAVRLAHGRLALARLADDRSAPRRLVHRPLA